MSPTLCLFAICQLGFSQANTSRIVGTITDSSGAVVAGATVTAKNEKTGDERSVKSNESGLYVISQLPPAGYSIEAQAPALGPTRFTDVRLSVGQERNLKIFFSPPR